MFSTRSTLVLCAALALAGCGGSDPDETPAAGWSTAFDASELGWLLSVWGPATDDVYCVGGTEAKGRAMHFDGQGWQAVELPAVPLLNWAFGFSGSDVTVVGNEGTVLHYDGSSWQLVPTPTDENLWGVWGAAPDDLWAVGGSGRPGSVAVVLHYDGTDWSLETLPALQKPNVRGFFKVWGTSADNVYVVGQNGAVVHRSGGQWQEELVGASDDLIALWGTGPDNIVAVGGRAAGIVSIWNGVTWRTESLGPLPGLNGVWTDDPSRVHLGGGRGTLGVLELESSTFTDQSVETELDIHAIHGTSGQARYAVGGNFLGPVPPYRGIALRHAP